MQCLGHGEFFLVHVDLDYFTSACPIIGKRNHMFPALSGPEDHWVVVSTTLISSGSDIMEWKSCGLFTRGRAFWR